MWAGDKNGAACESAGKKLGVPVSTDYAAQVPTSDLILMCVKPNDAPVVMAALRNAGLRRETLLISILAGVATDRLESLLGTENPVIRAMPNTPAIVGEGMTVVCRGRYARPRICKGQRIFEAVGKCLAVDEIHFNAVTALSGSGPGYQFLIMEALADAGVRVGLPRQLALTLVAQTALGAARMVLTTGRHPASLRDDVTTPAGCTIGGLLMLEEDGFAPCWPARWKKPPRFRRTSAPGPAKISENAPGPARVGIRAKFMVEPEYPQSDPGTHRG